MDSAEDHDYVVFAVIASASADIINLIGLRTNYGSAQATSSTPAALWRGKQRSVQVASSRGRSAARCKNWEGSHQLTIDPLAGTNSADPGAQLAKFQKAYHRQSS